MRIYVASSWRNSMQPHIVGMLRSAGHEVYDFRNPHGGTGFAWSDIDPNWQSWTAKQYIDALGNPIAEKGFRSDFDAMQRCDAIVLVLPCGRSAHLEAGWGAGAGKGVFVLTQDGEEPELMAKMCTKVVSDWESLLGVLVDYEYPDPDMNEPDYAFCDSCGACIGTGSNPGELCSVCYAMHIEELSR